MTKLLVNNPQGVQEIIEIGQGGKYFDDSRVVWDERVHGTLPGDLVLGGLVLVEHKEELLSPDGEPILDMEGNPTTFVSSWSLGLDEEIKSEQELVEEAIAAEKAKIDAVKKGLKAQAVGAKIIAMVWAINEAKDLPAEDFQAILADPTLQTVERLLWNGSLKTAKILIQGLSDAYFSAEDKAAVIAVIDESGLI